MTNKELACRLSALTVFRNTLKKDVLSAFLEFLKCEGDMAEKLSAYGEFVSLLSAQGGSFSEFLRKSVSEDENAYIKLKAAKKDVPESVRKNAAAELSLFTELSLITADSLWQSSGYEGYIPTFENSYVDFGRLYNERLENVDTLGYGIFASNGMFRVEDNKIIPVEVADRISVDNFIGYEKERQAVLENTRALTEGRPAQNVLLCGDAGTGKSSTVKASANYFFNKGVRLIELRKDQLFSLSYVMGAIAENPLKFIIFIDDLSFNKNDDCFSMLKAVLEGSAESRSSNAVIYATSNRRHIVKESFADRTGTDDVHRNDTMQELLSLSDRFGLTVYFQKPNKLLYLDIVHELAQRNGITMEKAQLDVKAEAFALSRGSRSPRAAEQFIKSLL
ncbi:MAG: ATP-binding protein [Clostridia bacterium]|nr:ATP-binding protein [Clostridia bacterium]